MREPFDLTLAALLLAGLLALPLWWSWQQDLGGNALAPEADSTGQPPLNGAAYLAVSALQLTPSSN